MTKKEIKKAIEDILIKLNEDENPLFEINDTLVIHIDEEE